MSIDGAGVRGLGPEEGWGHLLAAMPWMPWTALSATAAGWAERQPDDGTAVGIQIKANVIDGVGYAVFATDLEQIWYQELPASEWQGRWDLYNGEALRIEDAALFRFLHRNLTAPAGQDCSCFRIDRTPTLDSIPSTSAPTASPEFGLSISVTDSRTVRPYKWTLQLAPHPRSAELMHQQVTLPLVGMLSQRDRALARFADAVADRDDIIDALKRELGEAGITVHMTKRKIVPASTADELQGYSPFVGIDRVFGEQRMVAELYADPGFHAAAGRHFKFLTGVTQVTSDVTAAVASLGKDQTEPPLVTQPVDSLALSPPQNDGGAAKRGLKRQISAVGASIQSSQQLVPDEATSAAPAGAPEAGKKKKKKKKKRDL